MLEEPESRKDVNVRTAQMVQLITELGPDIPEIARRLGQFKESVRYRYKEKILGRGFAVQAMPDHERMGLKRMILIVDFADSFAEYAQTILTAMSDLCFVVGFTKTLPNGRYIVSLSVPSELAGSIGNFFNHLRSQGMFTSLEVFAFDWFRNVPMKAELFDFDSGRWDFDWSESRVRHFEAAADMPSSPTKYDHTDLLIIKELQKDANKTLTEISDELKLNYKKLAWHYNTHVVARRLLRGYRINWMGTRYDFKIDKALHRKHRYLAIDLLVKNTNSYDMAVLGGRANQLPFLWAEAGGENYVAEFFFPLDYVVEGLQFLGEVISDFKDRAEVMIIDQTNAVAFSIPYKLFDATQKAWIFSERDLTARFENLLQQIKNRTG